MVQLGALTARPRLRAQRHAAAAALLRLTHVLAVLAVLSPALAALAAVASDEGAVRQEGKPCVVDRAEDVVVGDRRLVFRIL